MTTDKQKEAVKFCEKILDVYFEGDINNYSQVSNFLYENLGEAKSIFLEAAFNYEAFLWELD